MYVERISVLGKSGGKTSVIIKWWDRFGGFGIVRAWKQTRY